jgi:predicted fused transcriptional regulator/phosphomethylpyrimidine kinase
MRMKSTTAFRAYTNIRARQTIERAAATARFMVKRVNKDGSISRAKPDRDAWLRDAFVTAEEAEKHRAALEAMNPGSRFTVVAL